MKKAILIFFSFLTFWFLSVSNAQASGDVIISRAKLSTDTLHPNTGVVLTFTVKNSSSGTTLIDTFPGNAFLYNVYIDSSTTTPFSYLLTPTWMDSMSNAPGTLMPGDTFVVSTVITIPSNASYAQRNKDNEVIIWPSKTFIDPNPNNNFYRIKFYYEDLSAIASVENNLLKVNIIPNPVFEKLNILCSDIADKAEIKIYDLCGKIAYQQSISANNLSLSVNVADWQKGVYLLQFDYKNKSQTMKFVVE